MDFRKAIILLLVFFSFFRLQASDTLKINLKQADSLFIVNNYYLLASAMNIDVQKAQIIQAKLYSNPVFTAEINAYDPTNKQLFHTGNTGEKAFQIQQLILLGGKRKVQIELAKTNANIAELEFQELVRQLKFQLHSSLYALNQQKLLIVNYNIQMQALNSILASYEYQANKGNIALKDVVRLKGVYLKLNNDRAELIKLYLEELAKVQTLLQVDGIVVPELSEKNLESIIKLYAFEELTETALNNRPDYLISQQNKLIAQQYFNYQKKMAIPDVNLFSSYDQRGGAFTNQVNVGVSIPLPVWNRNKGNIKSAQFQIKQFEYSELGLKNEIIADIRNSLSLYTQTVEEYNKTKVLYNSDFDLTLKGVSENFQKGNISLLEFVDFFEAYNDAMSEIARIKIQLAISAEHLNLTIGKELY